jgi:hypothetical protein
MSNPIRRPPAKRRSISRAERAMTAAGGDTRPRSGELYTLLRPARYQPERLSAAVSIPTGSRRSRPGRLTARTGHPLAYARPPSWSV